MNILQRVSVCNRNKTNDIATKYPEGVGEGYTHKSKYQ